jgi:hypothetical protein
MTRRGKRKAYKIKEEKGNLDRRDMDLNGHLGSCSVSIHLSPLEQPL